MTDAVQTDAITEEELEINKRLEWYHKSLEDKLSLPKSKSAPAMMIAPSETKRESKSKRSTLPIDLILLEIQQFMMSPAAKQLFVCEREIKCDCVDDAKCVCDSDDYFPVLSSKSDVGSNCNFTMEFYFHDPIALSRKKNLRFFALDSTKQDHETPVIDIVRTMPNNTSARGRKPIVADESLADTHVRFYCCQHQAAQPYIEFPLREGVTIGKQCVHFQFNYLSYA
jgi:hypothetical protein